MRRETLYFDTSVPSAYYDEGVKDRQDATIKFWKDALPNYKVYISEVTVRELEDTKDETLRRKFKSLIKSFKILKSNKKIRELANAYIERGVFPENMLMMPFT